MLQQIEKLQIVGRELGSLERTIKEIAQEFDLIRKNSWNREKQLDAGFEAWFKENVRTDEGDAIARAARFQLGMGEADVQANQNAPKRPSRIGATKAWENWETYAIAHGLKPHKQAWFGRQMRILAYPKTRIEGIVYYVGIYLQSAQTGS